MAFAIDPQMAALLAMRAGGNIMQAANTPGATLGGSLGAGFQSFPADLLTFHRAAAQKKLQDLRMKQAENELVRSARIQKARESIGTSLAKSFIPKSKTLTTPGGQKVEAPGAYEDIPEDKKAMIDALVSGDTQSLNFLTQRENLQAENARAAEQQQYQRQQDLIQNALAAGRYGLEQQRVGIQAKSAELAANKKSYSSPFNVMGQDGQVTGAVLDKNTGDLHTIQGQVIPKNAFSLDVGPDGTVRMTQGAPGVGLTSTDRSKINKQVVDTSISIDTLDRLEKSTRPEFFELETKLAQGGQNLLASLGIQSPNQLLAQRDNWRGTAKRNISEIVKAFSGAQVTDSERRWIEDFAGSPDKWFSNPQTFKTNLITMKYQLKRINDRWKDAMQSGSPKQFVETNPLEKYNSVTMRGDELYEIYTKAVGLDPQQAQQAVFKDLEREGWYQ